MVASIWYTKNALAPSCTSQRKEYKPEEQRHWTMPAGCSLGLHDQSLVAGAA